MSELRIGHEERDVGFRPVVGAGVAIGIGLVLAFGAMWALVNFYAVREAALSPPASPLAASYGRREPPAPRLQTHPLDDLAALRAAEAARLGGYGWSDRAAGRIHVPIDRAMELLAAGKGRLE